MASARLRLDHLAFPDPEKAHESGVLAVGGDLRPERLLLAYSSGIFPWPAEGYPLLWHAPPERAVVAPSAVRLGRTLRKHLKKQPFEIRLDSAFADVMRCCSAVPRPGQDGTWITTEMIEAYSELHKMGFAHSAEAWQDGLLVGGLYGVSLGRAFFGESMFSLADDASKIAFATLCAQLQRWEFAFVDAQVMTPLLDSLGATLVPRRQFGQLLHYALQFPSRQGGWQLDRDLLRGPRLDTTLPRPLLQAKKPGA